MPRSVEPMDPGWSETDEEIIQRAREKEQRVAKRVPRRLPPASLVSQKK